MKNHYKILQVSRNSKNNEIKEKARLLLNQIKKSKITKEEKLKLSKSVYESYKFLSDYHNRKSLDDYLDSQYKIVDSKSPNLKSSAFNDPMIGLISSFNLPFDLDFEDEIFNQKNNNSNNNSYYYVKSSTVKGEMDKDGNMVYKTVEKTNDNGKKNEKEFTNKVDKNKIKPFSFFLN